jgi:membrane peptidoglycan carboxypeptidase/D-alanyl-D-alanine carboxypeptidase
VLVVTVVSPALSSSISQAETVPLDKIPLGPTPVYDRNGDVLGYIGGGSALGAAAWDQIPSALRKATVAIEDKRFFRHHGVDYYRLLGALVADLRRGSLSEGGSTITMQVAKNLFEPNERRTFTQKVREIVLARRLEATYSKREILTMYLNGVFYGEGAVGVQAAALRYFGVPARKLTLAQAALLAGLTQAPTAYDPLRHPAAARRRRNLVLALMRDQGLASRNAAAAAARAPLWLRPHSMRARSHGQKLPARKDRYVLAYVRAFLVDRYGEARVQRGGFRVYTSIDSVLQAAAQRDLRLHTRSGRPSAARMVMVDARNGLVRVLTATGAPSAGASLAGRRHTERISAVLALARAAASPAESEGAVRTLDPLDVVGVFATFASRGFEIAPTVITRIDGPGAGGVAPPISHQVVSSKLAARVTSALAGPTEGGSDLQVPAATAELRGPNGAWFAGYTPDYVSAVWTAPVRSRNNAARNEATYAPAERMWQAFMARATSRGCFHDFSPSGSWQGTSLAATHIPRVGNQVPRCQTSALVARLQAWTRRHPATSALVVRLGGGGRATTVLAQQATVPRLPASTLKIVTGAAALISLGPNFRFQTRMYTLARPGGPSNEIRGPLWVKGYGDPILSTRTYSDRFLHGEGGNFDDLARELRARGVRTLRGSLIVDESFFDARRIGNYWRASYRGETGPLSALAINEDFADAWRRRFVDDPPLAAERQVVRSLAAAGIRHIGIVRDAMTPKRGSRLVAVVSSPPLRDIVRLMDVPSDIFIAETLEKDIGAYVGGSGTTRMGAAAVTSILRRKHVFGPKDTVVDGSGLSRRDRISARSLVNLLLAAKAQPNWGTPLLDSFPRSRQGTLWRRFITEPAAGLVLAKTGHLRDASALTGIVTSRTGQQYAFALMMNGYRHRDRRAADATQNQIVELLADGAADSPEEQVQSIRG